MNDRILILGGSSDIALALIERLLDDKDVRIVAQYFGSPERLTQLQSRTNGQVLAERCDLSDDGAIDALIARFGDAHGTPRAVIQLAGSKLRLERFSKWDQAHVTRDLQIQLLSTARVLRAFAPAMAKSPQPTQAVLVLSSVTRDPAPKFMSMYTVVKSAQLGLTRALAAEYAGTSLRVYGVSPGMVATRFLSAIPEKAVEMSAAQAPAGRLLRPDEVAAVIASLLSTPQPSGVEVDVPYLGDD